MWGEHAPVAISCLQSHNSKQCDYGNLHAFHCVSWLCLMHQSEKTTINNRCGHATHQYINMETDTVPPHRKIHVTDHFGCTNLKWKGWDGKVGQEECGPARPQDDVTSPAGCERCLNKWLACSQLFCQNKTPHLSVLFIYLIQRGCLFTLKVYLNMCCSGSGHYWQLLFQCRTSSHNPPSFQGNLPPCLDFPHLPVSRLENEHMLRKKTAIHNPQCYCKPKMHAKYSTKILQSWSSLKLLLSFPETSNLSTKNRQLQHHKNISDSKLLALWTGMCSFHHFYLDVLNFRRSYHFSTPSNWSINLQ